MSEDLPPLKEHRAPMSRLEKAFGIFVWLFVLGTAAVTVFFVVVFVMWGRSI